MPTKKFHFTKAAINALPAPATGRAIYRDDQQTGLQLSVFPTGKKSFVLVTKAGGKAVHTTLGQWPEVTVAVAREMASKARYDVRQGRNPKARSTAVMKFGALFERYIEGHAKPYKKSWRQDIDNHRLYLSALDGRPIDKITRHDVARWHQRVTADHGDYTANRALALLSCCFTFASDILGVAVTNPCKGVRRNKEQHRRRFLSAAELPRFLSALNEPQTPELWRDFFLMALFTGARRGNLQSMQWAHIDMQSALWSIPHAEAKADEQMDVPLVDPAMEILERRAPLREVTRYVFPSPRKPDGHVTEPKMVWKNILARAGIEDLRIHDLRRTHGSWQAAGGASLHIIGTTLGHRNHSTTEIYSQLDLDPVRASMTSAVSAMLDTVKD
jgi:integrase